MEHHHYHPQHQYLIYKRIVFICLCLSASIVCLAILLQFQSKLIQSFDITNTTITNITAANIDIDIVMKQRSSPLAKVNHHNHSLFSALFSLFPHSFILNQRRYINLLQNTVWINLILSSLTLVDITPNNFLMKYMFAIMCWLSLGVVLCVPKVAQLYGDIRISIIAILDLADYTVHYLICGEMLLIFISWLNIITHIRLYFRCIDRFIVMKLNKNCADYTIQQMENIDKKYENTNSDIENNNNNQTN